MSHEPEIGYKIRMEDTQKVGVYCSENNFTFKKQK